MLYFMVLELILATCGATEMAKEDVGMKRKIEDGEQQLKLLTLRTKFLVRILNFFND